MNESHEETHQRDSIARRRCRHRDMGSGYAFVSLASRLRTGGAIGSDRLADGRRDEALLRGARQTAQQPRRACGVFSRPRFHIAPLIPTRVSHHGTETLLSPRQQPVCLRHRRALHAYLVAAHQCSFTADQSAMNETPNHALQRTATLAFSYRCAALAPTGSVTACAPATKPSTCRAFASRRCAHLRIPGSRSLSLGSLDL